MMKTHSLSGNTVRQRLKSIQQKGLDASIKKISRSARNGVTQLHLLAFGYDQVPDLAVPIPRLALEIHELDAANPKGINELSDIDEWEMSPKYNFKRLDEGWICYICKHNGQAVASQWIYADREFKDPYLKRTFVLAPDQVYHYRGFCIPAFRGKSILPYLNRYVIEEMAAKYGKTRGLYLTVQGNRSMFKAYQKLGVGCVGKAGMIDLFGVRFHYLLGRRAFEATRKRNMVTFFKSI